MSDQQVTAERDIAAPADVLFGIVADPHSHPAIDGGGTVTGSVEGPRRLTAAGDRFGMRMRRGPLPYRVGNTVVEFEEDRLIAWRHLGGHRWRWEFEPYGDNRTRVRHTYVYGRSPAPWLLERLGFVQAAREGMPRSLANLERIAAERTAEADGDVTG